MALNAVLKISLAQNAIHDTPSHSTNQTVFHLSHLPPAKYKGGLGDLLRKTLIDVW